MAEPLRPHQTPRWEGLVLLIPVVLWASLIMRDTHFMDPDSYLHFGVAKRLVEDGWLSTFEWLPHTTLHDPYPNMYFGQHILLMPWTVFGPALGLKLGVLFLSSLGALSLYLVLYRARVAYPATWVAIGLIGSPVALSYALSIKGAATFLILLPWFVEAVWRADEVSTQTGWRRLMSGPWRVFGLAWLSVYIYVGASVLLGFVVAHLVIGRLWGGRLDLRPLLATIGGLLVGMLLHPAWPAQWEYVMRELMTVFGRDANLVAGELRGAEWAIQPTDMLVRLIGLMLLLWGGAMLLQMRRGLAIPRDIAATTLASFGLLFGAFFSGTKLMHLFVVFSILTLPRLFTELLQRRDGAPARRAPLWVALGVGLCAATWSYTTLRSELEQPAPRPRDYEVLAQWVAERTAPREMVIVPWDDMPGLFLFGTDQRFMAGFNVQFLRDQDEARYNAFVFFWRGQIADPEATMVRFFDGARLVILPRQPRTPGEAQLALRLSERRDHFAELASPVPQWRVFQRRSM